MVNDVYGMVTFGLIYLVVQIINKMIDSRRLSSFFTEVPVMSLAVVRL